MALVLGELSVLLTANVGKFKGALAGASKALRGVGSDMSSMGRSSLVIGTALAGVGFKLATMAADARSVAGRMGVVFGDMGADVDAWAKRTGAAIGRSRFNLRAMATGLGETLVPSGLASDAIADMSMKLSELAVDIAAAKNIPEELALEKLKDALHGSVGGMKDLGIAMKEDALETFLLEQGLGRNIDAMTDAEKIALRYQFVLAKTGQFTGAAADDSKELSGQMARLKGTLTDVAISIGTKLIPVFTDIAERVRLAVEWFDNLDSSSKDLLLKVGVIAGAMALLGAALIPLGAVVGALATIAGVLASVVSPSLLVGAIAVAALVAAFGALRQAWQEFETPIKAGLDWVLGRLDDFLDRIDDTIQKLVDLGLAVAEAFQQRDWVAFGKALLKLGAGLAKAVVNPLQVGTPQAAIPEGNSNADRAAMVKTEAAAAFATISEGVKEFVLAPLKEAFVSGLEGLAELVPADVKDKLTGVFGQFLELMGKVTGKVGGLGDAAQDAGKKVEVAGEQATKTLGQKLVELWTKLGQWFDRLPGAAQGAAAVLGGALNQGEIGATVQGAVAGGQQGGPWGAVAGAIAGLFSTTEDFAMFLEQVNGTLRFVAGILSGIVTPVLQAIYPALEGLRAALAPLVPFLVVLTPVFRILAAAGLALAFVFRIVFEVFRVVAMGILRIVRWVLKAVGKSTRKIDRALDDLKDMSFDTAGDIEDLGDAADEATEALLNVPEGVKIAAYRWAATTAEGDYNLEDMSQAVNPDVWNQGGPNLATPAGATSSSATGSSGNAATSSGDPELEGRNVLYVEQLIAMDMDKAVDELERAARRKNYVARGRPVAPVGLFTGRKD